MEHYTAMIADVADSRKLAPEAREALQLRLVREIDELNRQFADALIKPIAFSAGDEIQSLFRGPEAAILCCRQLILLLGDTPIRAGFGIGGWEVRVADAGTTAQDGTAYHRAREAIEAAEQYGESVLIRSGDDPTDAAVNALLGAALRICAGRRGSRVQQEAARALERACPLQADGVPACGAAAAVPIPNEADGFFIRSGIARGMPIRLAALLKVSPQSARGTLKAAGVYEERNLTIAALGLLHDRRERT